MNAMPTLIVKLVIIVTTSALLVITIVGSINILLGGTYA